MCYEIPMLLNENPLITITFVILHKLLWIAQSTDQSNKFSLTVYISCIVYDTNSETRTVLNTCGSYLQFCKSITICRLWMLFIAINIIEHWYNEYLVLNLYFCLQQGYFRFNSIVHQVVFLWCWSCWSVVIIDISMITPNNLCVHISLICIFRTHLWKKTTVQTQMGI